SCCWVVEKGVEWREVEWRGVQGRSSGSVVGELASGSRICGSIRALARYQGQGDPARQIPCPFREGRVPGAAIRRLPGPVDARRVRSSGHCDAGEGGVRTYQSQPGTTLGCELARSGDRPPGAHGDPLPPPTVRRTGKRRAGPRSNRPGGAVEPRFLGGACPPRRELAVERRRRNRWEGVNAHNLMGPTRSAACWTMCSSSTGTVEDHSTLFHPGRSGSTPSFLEPVGGLQMVQSFEHIPVLRDEVVALFAPVHAGVIIDATLGGGG